MLLETSWAGMVNLYVEFLSLRTNPLNFQDERDLLWMTCYQGLCYSSGLKCPPNVSCSEAELLEGDWIIGTLGSSQMNVFPRRWSLVRGGWEPGHAFGRHNSHSGYFSSFLLPGAAFFCHTISALEPANHGLNLQINLYSLSCGCQGFYPSYRKMIYRVSLKDIALLGI